MKSERRHELEQNQLADWLGAQIETAKPYANAILAGLLLVLVVVVAWVGWNRYSSSSKTALWTDYYKSMGNPTQMATFVENHGNDDAGQMAALYLADDYLRRGADELFQSKARATDDIRKAVEYYKLVLDKSTKQAFRQRATFGLARAREATAELKEAIKLYEEVVQKSPNTMYEVQAKDRLRDLRLESTKEMYETFVSFDPKPSYSPATGGRPLDLSTLPGEPPTANPSRSSLPATTHDFKLETDRPLGSLPEKPVTPPKDDSPKSDDSKPVDPPKPETPVDGPKPVGDTPAAGEK